MDIVTYALAKKMASSVASGITEVQTDGTNIRFKTAEGEWFTVRLNSVEDATVSGTGHLIIELTDGTTIDAGVLPVSTMDTALSATSENGVQNKVITAALNGKQNVLTAGTGVTIDNTDPANPEISANVDYTNLINKPTKLSDFTNDEDFIDNTVNNLTNYYLKTQTYTQTEVNDLISHLASLTVEIVETLPTQDISTSTIYLVNVAGTTNYEQWMYINSTWSNIGNTSVDLSNYYTKTQTDTLLADKVDKVTGKGLSTNDFSDAYKDMLDNYTVDSVLDSTSTNPIQNGTVTDALALKQPKTLSAPIVVGGVSSTTVEGALGNLNTLVDTKLPMVTSLPASPSNGEAVLYIGTATGGLKTGGIYQYQVSEWVLISTADAAHIAQNTANFAPAFSEVTSYEVGDYCTYNNVLYRCTTAHTAGAWVAGHFTAVTVGGDLNAIVSNAYNPSSYGGYTTGTKTWWKISNLFVAGSDFTYRTNVFLLSSREGSGTALLTIGDNGSNIRSAQIIMLNGILNGVGDFYFDASTSSLYYSMQWSRLQIVQLSGQKIDIREATQSSSSEATQYTAITPSTLASIDNTNNLIRMRRICLTDADSVIQIARTIYFKIPTSDIAKMEMKAIKSDGTLLWDGYVTATGAHGSMVITNMKWAGSSSAVTFNEWGTPTFANDGVASIFELTNLSTQ